MNDGTKKRIDGILFVMSGMLSLFLWLCSNTIIAEINRFDCETGEPLPIEGLQPVTFLGTLKQQFKVPYEAQFFISHVAMVFLLSWGIWTITRKSTQQLESGLNIPAKCGNKLKSRIDGTMFIMIGLLSALLFYLFSLIVVGTFYVLRTGEYIPPELLPPATLANALQKELGISRVTQNLFWLVVTIFFFWWGFWTLNAKSHHKPRPNVLHAFVKIKKYYITLAVLVIATTLYVTSTINLPSESKMRLNPTIDPSSFSGVSIPADLEACFVELDKMLSTEFINYIKEGSEERASGFHHGFGTWLRNNWGLWHGSVLSEWFNARGITHPDDMSSIILDSYWRHLNNLPIHERTADRKPENTK